MQTYTLWRELDPAMDDAERESTTLRAIGGLEWYPDVRWLHSWVINEPERLQSLCVYEGPDRETVERASTRCRVPFVEVRETRLFLPDDYLADEQNRPLPGKPYFMITRQYPADLSEDELNAAAFRSGHCLAYEENIYWLRSYWDEERKFSRCIYQATDEERIRRHARIARLPCDAIDVVTEDRPENWAWAFDAMGMPHIWEAPAAGGTLLER